MSNSKSRSSNTVDEITRFVALGYSQSAANCRVLLDKIQTLALENKRLKKENKKLQAFVNCLPVDLDDILSLDKDS